MNTYRLPDVIQVDIGDYSNRYAGILSGVDTSVGRVLTYLEKERMPESTLIVYWDDNAK